jgi:2',3'-cyclic-nucleotide 2'-phosphodiesterase (5'-nucleotidase family)
LCAADLKKKGIKAIAVLAHMSAEQNGSAITGESAKLASGDSDCFSVFKCLHDQLAVDFSVYDFMIVRRENHTADLKKKGIKAIAVLAHMSAEQNGSAITGESAKHDILRLFI